MNPPFVLERGKRVLEQEHLSWSEGNVSWRGPAVGSFLGKICRRRSGHAGAIRGLAVQGDLDKHGEEKGKTNR